MIFSLCLINRAMKYIKWYICNTQSIKILNKVVPSGEESQPENLVYTHVTSWTAVSGHRTDEQLWFLLEDNWSSTVGYSSVASVNRFLTAVSETAVRSLFTVGLTLGRGCSPCYSCIAFLAVNVEPLLGLSATGIGTNSSFIVGRTFSVGWGFNGSLSIS